MSDNQKFDLDTFLKKVQEGDTSLLVIGVILLIIPLLAIYFFGANDSSGKKVMQQRMRNAVQRKNVFNFSTQDKKGNTISSSRAGSQGSFGSSGGSFFTARTEEQVVADELSEAMRTVENSMRRVEAPSHMDDEARQMYEAEHNYNLCMANGAIENGRFEEAETFLKQAIDEAAGNAFLTAYAYASLCSLYETMGDTRKMEEAYKRYIEAVGNLPESFGGGDLKSIVRNAYQSLKGLKDADVSKMTEAMSVDKLSQSPDFANTAMGIKDIAGSFPVKYK